MEKLEALIALVGEVKIKAAAWPDEWVVVWIDPRTYHLELESGGSVEGAISIALMTAKEKAK